MSDASRLHNYVNLIIRQYFVFGYSLSSDCNKKSCFIPNARRWGSQLVLLYSVLLVCIFSLYPGDELYVVSNHGQMFECVSILPIHFIKSHDCSVVFSFPLHHMLTFVFNFRKLQVISVHVFCLHVQDLTMHTFHSSSPVYDSVCFPFILRW